MTRPTICVAAALIVCSNGCSRSQRQTEYRLWKAVEDPAGGGDSAISPDGRSFVTSLRRNGNWDLWTYHLDTGRWTQITNDPADDFEGQWSPDARQIVFTSTRTRNKDVFLLSLADGSVKQLTDDAEDDEYPSFAPDGSTVIYTGGKWMHRDFYVMDLNGKGRRGLRKQLGLAGACSYHPSGFSAICHSYDSGTGNVELLPINGGNAMRITNGSFWDYKPTVSPNGDWAAFSRSHDGQSQIWMMPFPIGDAFPLTGSDGDDRWPTWSRNADRLMFHRLVDRGIALRVYDRETGESRVIAGRDELPVYGSFHPGGSRIVLSSLRGGKEHLLVADVATGGMSDLPTDGYEAGFPRWSPDGKHLAFVVRAGERWEVAIADAAGAGVRILTAGIPNLRSMRGPLDWSPDSSRIIFKASVRPFEADLYIADVRSGRVENLTRDRWFNEAPAFTPDGDAVTFMSTRGGGWTWGLFRMALANRKYTTFAGPDYEEKNFPRVGRDGSTVWSGYAKDGKEYLVERSATGATRVLDGAGAWARWPSYSGDGRQVVYTEIDHRVEYWVADNITAGLTPRPGHPPTVLSKAAPDEHAGSEDAPNRTGARASPVQMHHR
jgi:TolB protein